MPPDRLRAREVDCLRGPVPLRRLRRLHGHAARGQPARRVHGRPRASRRAAAAARARAEVLGDRLRLPGRAGAHARMRIFTPASEIPFAGHPTLGTAFVLGGAAAARRDPARNRHGRRARHARARGRADRLRTHEPAAAVGRAVRRRGGPCSRRSASSAPSCRSSSTTTGSDTSTSACARLRTSPR